MTVTYKSGRKHNEADCLLLASLEEIQSNHEDVDGFLGLITAIAMASEQYSDPELKALIDYLQHRADDVPTIFRISIPSFSIRNGVLSKQNYQPQGTASLLVIPTSMRPEILASCHDEPCSHHLGYRRTLARIRE